MISAAPVVLPRASLLHADHGRQPAPGLPCALSLLQRGKAIASLESIRLRECEVMSGCLKSRSDVHWDGSDIPNGSIGVGIGFRRPRPPNRTGGFPAYGSPVGGFFIETVSQFARPHEVRTAQHLRRRLAPCDAVTSADSIHVVHTSASIQPQRGVVSSPCLASSALAVLLCFGTILAHPPPCPAFPRMGFATPPSHDPCTRPHRYYAGSDFCCVSPTQQTSPVHSLAVPASRPQPRHAARRHVPITSCRRSTLRSDFA